MLNFDQERFLGIQAGAVALADPIDAAIDRAFRNGARNVFFLGTGGAAILMGPAVQLLMRQSGTPVFQEVSAELVLTGHQALGANSIVVIPSLSGTTRESVAAMEFCQARGATVLALVGHADTPLGQGADLSFVNFAEDDTSSESFYLLALFVALSVMRHRGEFDLYDSMVGELRRLPAALLEAKRAIEPRANEIAAAISDCDDHIIVGSGSTWPEAFYYGMCILEEMQWIRTRPVHGSDFFHGTLELVEEGVSVVVFKGEDATRPVVDRVERFARDHTDRLLVLDTAEFALSGLSDDVRRLVSPIVLATVLERVSAHLEVLRDHPLTTRRYYRRVAY
ncbi:MAG: SIS domain-containing protein [Hyphomicrobiales bacterium]|nr:SIS domain-containing protein [Hyphomicrobiales bacterium]